MKRRGFTLTELLIVIAIIVILAGLLMVAIGNAQKDARATACMGNMKNFGMAISQYQTDSNEEFPMWLSQMQSALPSNSKVFQCLSDENRGADGSMPNKGLGTSQKQYAETNDFDSSLFKDNDSDPNYNGGCDPTDATRTTRGYAAKESGSSSSAVKACSYLYEWTGEICSWDSSQTWRDAKKKEASADCLYGTEIMPDGSNVYQSTDSSNIVTYKADAKMVHTKQAVPVVRCFHHQPITNGALEPLEYKIINLRIDLSAINRSPPNFWWIQK